MIIEVVLESKARVVTASGKARHHEEGEAKGCRFAVTKINQRKGLG
jgi:hypothetical protein